MISDSIIINVIVIRCLSSGMGSEGCGIRNRGAHNEFSAFIFPANKIRLSANIRLGLVFGKFGFPIDTVALGG